MKSYIAYVLDILAVSCIVATAAYGETAGVESKEEVYRRYSDNQTLRKSGTPEIIKLLDSEESNALFKQAYSESTRPTRDTYADSDHFRVHYNTSGSYAPDLTDKNLNNIPDYVDSTLAYLEFARTKLIGLGYGTPKSDGSLGGSSATDCYISELASQSVYGYTMPDNNSLTGTVSSYIVLDNNYTDNIYITYAMPALRITSAHEYFHVIQFSYYGGNDVVWWMEQTAVWFEDYTWDDVNDYLNWVSLVFDNRNYSIDTYNGSFEYAGALFAMYISQYYGTDMLRSIWNKISDEHSGEVSILDEVLPDGVGEALAGMGVWLYFTGSRANTDDFFDESDIINDMIVPDTYIETLPQESSLLFNSHYTFDYIEVEPSENFAYGDTLICNLTDSNNGNWANKLILYNNPTSYEVVDLSETGGSLLIEMSWKKAIIVEANYDESDFFRRSYAYEIDVKNPVAVEEESLPQTYAISQNYPNPFNPVTTIPFSLPEDGFVNLRVFNTQGQVVAVLLDEYARAGTYAVPFDATSLPSGIYIAQLRSGSHTINRKMLMMK